MGKVMSTRQVTSCDNLVPRFFVNQVQITDLSSSSFVSVFQFTCESLAFGYTGISTRFGLSDVLSSVRKLRVLVTGDCCITEFDGHREGSDHGSPWPLLFISLSHCGAIRHKTITYLWL
jgi:hypothetical protein